MGRALSGGLTFSRRNFTVLRLDEMWECSGSNVTINGMFFSVMGRVVGFSRVERSVWDAFFLASINSFIGYFLAERAAIISSVNLKKRRLSLQMRLTLMN